MVEIKWSNNDNYSVYQYNKTITEINGSLKQLAYQITMTSLTVTGLTNGKYCFVIVAHNNLGHTFSNNRYITVQLAGGFDTIIISIISVISIGSVVGVAYIVWRNLVKKKSLKHKDKIDHKKPKHK